MLALLRLLGLLLAMEIAPGDQPGGEPEEEPADDEDEEGIRNPRLKELSAEAARWRKKFRAAEARITELEAAAPNADDIRAVRLEAAFWRQLVVGEQRIGDHESAWDLMSARGFLDLVKVAEDGEVAGMDEAFDKLLARYPWLLEEPIAEPDGEPVRRSTSPPKKRKDQAGPQYSRAQLQQRLPALRRHSR